LAWLLGRSPYLLGLSPAVAFFIAIIRLSCIRQALSLFIMLSQSLLDPHFRQVSPKAARKPFLSFAMRSSCHHVLPRGTVPPFFDASFPFPLPKGVVQYKKKVPLLVHCQPPTSSGCLPSVSFLVSFSFQFQFFFFPRALTARFGFGQKNAIRSLFAVLFSIWRSRSGKTEIAHFLSPLPSHCSFLRRRFLAAS